MDIQTWREKIALRNKTPKYVFIAFLAIWPYSIVSFFVSFFENQCPTSDLAQYKILIENNFVCGLTNGLASNFGFVGLVVFPAIVVFIPLYICYKILKKWDNRLNSQTSIS